MWEVGVGRGESNGGKMVTTVIEQKEKKKCSYSFFFLRFIYFQTEGKGGKKEGEKHQCVVASHKPPTGGLACNPGMCPDWELNLRSFGLQTGAQSTEPHQPDLTAGFLESCDHIFKK